MNELLALLKGMAPAVAGIVAGPLGGLAITAIADKFGVSDSVEAVAQAIAGDPQAAQKLAELDLRQFELEIADRNGARHMQEVALQQEDKFAKHFIYWFAWFWSVGSMGRSQPHPGRRCGVIPRSSWLLTGASGGVVSSPSDRL